MPVFNPNIPVAHTPNNAAEIRDNFQAIHDEATTPETDPVFAASEAALLVPGDKAKIDAIPSGNTGEVQFNNAGALAASPGLKFYDSGAAERSLEVSIPTGSANLTVTDNGGGDIQSVLNLTGATASMSIRYLDLPQEVLIQNDGTGGVTLAPSVKTGNPGSGPGRWQLGQVQAGAVAVDNARYVEVSIDGVVVKLLVAV